MPLNGVVLAGGRSTRMGCEKAFLRLEGAGRRTLISRQVALLRELGLGEVMVSLRRDMAYAEPGITIVHDPVEGLGPLGGIAAAMRRAPARHLVVLAVDMPHVGRGLLGRLLSLSSAERGAAARASDRWEPLCAVYPPGSLPFVERMLDRPRSAGRSPTALLDTLFARGRIRALAIPPQERWRLESWNQPEDLPSGVVANRGGSAQSGATVR